MFSTLRISTASFIFLLLSQAVMAQPNPYRLVEDWMSLPDGREMGAVGGVEIDPDGRHIWVVIRCDAGSERFGWECLDADLDSIFKIAPDGTVAESFGGGDFIWPHGIEVDDEGNVWVADAASVERVPDGDTRGHKVVKYSPTGEVLMVLGTSGVAGNYSTHFNAPADIAIAENGDIFIVDGHATDTNNRIVKFSSDGDYLMEWGQTGYAPGEFRGAHAIEIDDDGRVFVADRFNNRIQLFDQEGNHLSTWTQFGRPSGIFFDDHGRIYVTDSESDDIQNPGWEMGIRIGDAVTGWVEEFILYAWGDPRNPIGNGAEFVAVDLDGNLYGGEPRPRKLQKYVRVKP
jgi:DNA-binding beta-propeller fold protein YncE